MAVRWDVSQAHGLPVLDSHVLDRNSIYKNFAFPDPAVSHDHFLQLLLPVAIHPGNAQDFSGTDLQTDGFPGPLMKAHTFQLQNGLAGFLSPLCHDVLHLPAHHLGGQLLLIGGAGVAPEHHLPLPDDCNAVRQGHGLIQLMGDEYDGLAVFL